MVSGLALAPSGWVAMASVPKPDNVLNSQKAPELLQHGNQQAVHLKPERFRYRQWFSSFYCPFNRRSSTADTRLAVFSSPTLSCSAPAPPARLRP
jgi:hypothetical protein